VPHDADPDEPDPRQTSAPVVSLPGAGEDRVPRSPGRKRPPKSKAAPRSKASSGPDAAPPPRPPLPADLAAAGIVVPPKPPLPVTDTVSKRVAAPAQAEPEPEPEPRPASETPIEAAPEVLTPAIARGDALVIRGITKSFGDTRAVEGIDLTVPAGTFYGLVGPNGAGKTTTLSMIAGLLRPDKGTITVAGVDAASHPRAAKRMMGVLPDRLRIFDRLTGRQLLYYYGVLRGLSPAVVERRTADLARAFDLSDALGRVVSDYSAGMVKKVMLAGALIHSPRLLVLDEPFEAVDPVSSAIILDILSTYVSHGGTVILSSHGMDLVERVCSRVAVLVAGQVLAEGTIDEVRGELTLEQRFIELAGGLSDVEGLEWLHTFSD
jgi:ABC-2 type transport system ATP-binding protein